REVRSLRMVLHLLQLRDRAILRCGAPGARAEEKRRQRRREECDSRKSFDQVHVRSFRHPLPVIFLPPNSSDRALNGGRPPFERAENEPARSVRFISYLIFFTSARSSSFSTRGSPCFNTFL